MTDQTIKQYAKTSKIPLKSLIDYLKKFGINNSEESVTSSIEELIIKYEFETEISNLNIQFRNRLKKTDFNKIASICDLCLNLISPSKSEKIKLDLFNSLKIDTSSDNLSLIDEALYNRVVIKDIIISEDKIFDFEYFVINQVGIKNLKCLYETMTYHYEYQSINIPSWVKYDHGVSLDKDFNKYVSSLKNKKQYTDALIYSFYFLCNETTSILTPTDTAVYRSNAIVNSINIKGYDFRKISVLADLFLDIGEIDSALALYEIDEKIYNNINSLVLLALCSLQLNKVEQTKLLLKKLLDREPYHPSINELRIGIERLENRKLLQSNSFIDTSDIDKLTGIEFENLLLDKFISLGFMVKSTPKSGDYGADLVVENTLGTVIIIQCKRFNSKVNLKAVQEVIGALGHYSGDIGIVITNSSFYSSAINLAESHDIELWDGDCLLKFLVGDLSFTQIEK